MKITKQHLKKLIREAMELDLEVGDVILTGKFKNKRKVVKSFGKDDLGQPTINGVKALTFRIEKLMPKDKWSKKSKEALEFADQVQESKMKITKSQLKRIIREEVFDPADPHEEAEYERGYQDGLEGYPIADDASLSYDAGYEDGSLDAEKPE